jgi:drug/metabolite transporter (DMT)-like permease
MWLVYSFTMFVASILMYLLIRVSRNQNIDRRLVSVGLFGVPAIILAIYMIYAPQYLVIKPYIILVGILSSFFISYLGNVASLLGMEQAQNPGYSLVIQKGYAVFTSIATVFLFNSHLTYIKMFAIIIILISTGVIILSDSKTKVGEKKKSYIWVFYSIYCFFVYGLLSLLGKWVGSVEKVPTITWLFYTMTFIALWVLIDYLIHIKGKLGEFLKISRKQLLTIILSGVCLIVFSISLQNGRVLAPNAGYVDAINASSNAFFTLFTAFIFKDHLTFTKIIAIFAAVIGLSILVIN